MKYPYTMFEVFGIELEYMIVNDSTLAVVPMSDILMKEIAGEITSDIKFGEICWSNELVLHVIEFKTTDPVYKYEGFENKFLENIKRANNILKKFNAKLLPSGAHPLMDPHKETKLWPHDSNEIYDAYNRIFDCRGHGWSNLQSTHLNLPFGNDEEFGLLHAAIRMVLPLIPALAASTPILDGVITGFRDTRLEYYRKNQARIPSLTGAVIPEQAFSLNDYSNKIFKKIYHDIEPFDKDDIMKYEWLNSRGAIARFDRGSIEIRIMDIQETPLADLAILDFIIGLIKSITEGKWGNYYLQKSFNEIRLSQILLSTIKNAEKAIIDDEEYLDFFGITGSKKIAAEILEHIYLSLRSRRFLKDSYAPVIEKIIANGSLATRILNEINKGGINSIPDIYNELSINLANGKLYKVD
ncbi:MAG: hypothetical protein K9G57_01330 [Ignavibacteriales bacterium]|nr:hypothetical protein [Ignavibacteriales bacterium]